MKEEKQDRKIKPMIKKNAGERERRRIFAYYPMKSVNEGGVRREGRTEGGRE